MMRTKSETKESLLLPERFYIDNNNTLQKPSLQIARTIGLFSNHSFLNPA